MEINSRISRLKLRMHVNLSTFVLYIFDKLFKILSILFLYLRLK